MTGKDIHESSVDWIATVMRKCMSYLLLPKRMSLSFMLGWSLLHNCVNNFICGTCELGIKVSDKCLKCKYLCN